MSPDIKKKKEAAGVKWKNKHSKKEASATVRLYHRAVKGWRLVE